MLFAGDPHGQFRPIINAVNQHRPEAVVLLGDMDAEQPLDECLEEISDLTEIYFIPGNHDYDREGWYNNLFGSSLSANNLDGRVVEVAGVKIAGLGGVFKGKVWHPESGIRWSRREDLLHFLPSNVSKHGLRRHHEAAIWYEDYERLAEQEADILVTHEAPSCHRHGFEELDVLAEMMGVKRIFHGHHHSHYKAHLESGINVCGAPLQGVVDINGDVIVGGTNGH
ncbi:MAG: metallophosphoesterase [Cycloclasticus sp.]|nr:MAG: metallophosphoesterase [Cycloclasticus sp.]